MSTRRKTDSCSSWDNGECVGTPHCPPRCPRLTDKRGVPSLVRPYRETDFEALATMYEEFDESVATMGLPPLTWPRIEDWLAALTADGWNLVVLSDDRLVGHLAVTPRQRLEHEFVVFVHTDFQNRGIGTELLEQLVATPTLAATNRSGSPSRTTIGGQVPSTRTSASRRSTDRD